jgi:hypothetical protein
VLAPDVDARWKSSQRKVDSVLVDREECDDIPRDEECATVCKRTRVDSHACVHACVACNGPFTIAWRGLEYLPDTMRKYANRRLLRARTPQYQRQGRKRQNDRDHKIREGNKATDRIARRDVGMH